MKRPKNFLLLVLLLSVVAIALAAAFHATRHPSPAALKGSSTPELSRKVAIPNFESNGAPSAGTPSAAAQKRAKDFNDATNRFNAPDDQPR